MAKFLKSQKVKRQDPNWIYLIRQEALQIIKERWWGGTTMKTYYKVDVRAYAEAAAEMDTDYLEFSITMPKPLHGESLEKFVNEQHESIRVRQTERDIEKIREEQRKKEAEALKERIRREAELEAEKKAQELERIRKEEQEKNDIGIGD